MAIDVTQLVNNANPRVSQLNVNSKTYEIWDGTARNAIKELQDILYGLNTASGSDLDGMIEKVNAIYNELTKLGNENEGLASSVLDTLFSKFTGDKANQALAADEANHALVADKVGTTDVGTSTQPVYIKAGVPTQVTYNTTTGSGGPTDDATLTSNCTFVIPQVSQDAGGQVTVTNRTMTMPSLLALGTSATTAAKGNHTHTAQLKADTGTSSITLASGGKYKLTAGGETVIFTMPDAPSYSVASGGPTANATLTSGGTFVIPQVAQAADGQLTVTERTMTMPSLLSIGTTEGTAADATHTHDTSIATSDDTSALALAFGSKYSLNAGGTSFVFTMPDAPVIPTVNNAKLTINGQSGKVEFTANASSAVTKTASLYEKSAPSSTNNFTLELGIKFE